MEIVIIGVIVLLGLAFWFNRKSFDVNQDGKVDKQDAVEAVKKVEEVAVKVEEEVKAEVQKVTKKAKETAKKVKTTVASKTAKKPRSKA